MMNPSAPDILALDFDGVICDGLIEYFQTAWRAYSQLVTPPKAHPPEGVAQRFYRLRPVIETGWEMPLLIHALLQGMEESTILEDWPTLVQQLAADCEVSPQQAAAAVDGIRDQWIQTDLSDWLNQHRFYPGILERLQQAQQEGIFLMIISTKEGRFIQQLLAQGGLAIAPDHILGKEVRQPKYQTLEQIQQSPPIDQDTPQIWFVEDRIKALEQVKQQDELDTLQLFLADWGYNLEADKQAARLDPRIHCLGLSQFTAPFATWLTSD